MIRDGGHHGIRHAARPPYYYRQVRIHLVLPQQVRHRHIVCVVPNQSPIRIDNGIHRLDPGRRGV